MIEGPDSTLGWWTGGIVAILAAIHRIWIVYRKERVGTAHDAAEITLLESLTNRIRATEERAERAEERADIAFRERNEAMMELGRLRGEVDSLRIEVQALRRRLGGSL